MTYQLKPFSILIVKEILSINQFNDGVKMKWLIFLLTACLFFSGCTAVGYLLGSSIKQNEEIEVIQPGSDVYITMVNGNQTEGQFSGVKDSNLYLIIDEHDWAIPITDIEQIEVANKKWRYIGAAIGFGMDLAICGLYMSDNPILGDDFHMGF